MSKILRNQNGFSVDITDTGVTVAANTDYTIPPQDYATFAASSNIIELIANLTIILNDGGNDITNISQAIDIIKGWCPQLPDAAAPAGMQIFDANGLPIDSVLDASGIRRLAMDIPASELDVIGDIYACPSSVSVADAVYVSADDTVDQAISDDSSKKFAIGIVAEKVTATTARVIYTGKIAGFTGLTTGSPVFLSDTILGGLTQTPPTGSGKWLQVIGMATAANAVDVQLGHPIKRI